MNTKEIVLNGLVVGSVATTGNFEQDAEAVRQFMKERGLWKKVEPGSAIFGQAVAFANAAAALHQKTIENPSK